VKRLSESEKNVTYIQIKLGV